MTGTATGTAGIRAGAKVAVVGAGTMGRGIALAAARAGYRISLQDPAPGALVGGLEAIHAILEKGIALGKETPEGRDAALSRLETTGKLAEAVSGAALVVEAVPESMELKSGLFRTMEGLVPEQALLATNTSSLSIDRLAGALERPDRFLGLHFFNPVHLMALVEVVRGTATRPDVIAAGLDFARSLGKEPIVVRDSPGFASSRLGLALGLEAIRMVEQDVASAQDIDKAMVLGYRHPMGPLRLTDLVGLDVRLGIAEYLHETLGGDRFRPPRLLRSMVEEGRLGRKTGHGFYNWNEDVSR